MTNSMRTIRAVVGRPGVRRLVLAFGVFSVVEWASWIGLAVYAFERGGAAEVGIVGALVYLPSVVIAPFASVVGDRRPRAHLLVATYLVQAIAMAATFISLLVAPPLAVYVLAVAAASTITPVRPAHAALLPEVVDAPEDLAAANAASGTVEGVGALAGPLVAAALVSVGGSATVYAACALLAFGSTLAALPIARAARQRPAASTGDEPAGLAETIVAGWRAIGHDRRLTGVVAIIAGSFALLGALDVLVTVIGVDLLGGGDSSIGYVAALAGLGSVVGAGATGLAIGRERLGGILVIAALVQAVALAAIGLGPSLVILTAVIVTGFGWAFAYVQAITLAQRLVGDDVMSRVFGVIEAIMTGAEAAGALLVPILIGGLGPSGVIVACGVGGAVLVVAVAPIVIRGERHHPAMAQKLRVLRRVPMFGPLSAPVLERLAAGAEWVEVPPGTPIVTAGEVGDRFFVIADGEVEVTLGSARRRLVSGDSFGEIALVRDVPRTATVTTLVQTDLVTIARGPFLAALTGQPRSREMADAESTRRLTADVTG